MKILESIKVGSTTLKNRVMFPPLTTGYEEKDGSIGERSFNFYTRLAKGGVAYVVIGDVTPVDTVSPTPKLYKDEQIPSFKKLADELHKYDCKLGLQIFHPEYDSEAVANLVHKCWALKAQGDSLVKEGKVDEGNKILAESKKCETDAFAMLHHGMLNYVNEVSKDQLDVILERITECVKRAIKANVDIIEVHGDRLVGSLCSKILNKRKDEFGGSFENRTKFALKVVDAIRKGSKDITIDYKLPIVTKQKDGTLIGKGGLEIDEAVKLAKLLESHGVNMFHVAQANHTGNFNDTIPAMGTREYSYMLDDIKKVKEAVGVPVSTVGRIINPVVGEQLIEKGVCDIVAYGRSLLCDPDIVNKLMDNKPETIRQCMSCNKGCTDAITKRQFLSCVINAENGHEGERQITPANKKQNVAVIGAGIAGLEAARVLATKGHHVDLFEKSMKIGGQLNIASVPPRKEEMKRALEYYSNVLKDLDVSLLLNTEPSKKDLAKYKNIIVAIGASNLIPKIPGINNCNVISAWDVLANRSLPYGKVVICGGGLVGTETAEYLANKGLDVTIVEMMDKIAAEESSTVLPTMMDDLKKHNVEIKTLCKIKEITLEGVKVDKLRPKDGQTSAPARPGVPSSIEYEVYEEEMIKCDVVVNALASKKNTIDLEGLKSNIIYVGDCAGDRPSNIEHAVKTAYDAANSIN